MAKSKYEGGARVTTFRLPLNKFEEAKRGIQMFLMRYKVNPILSRELDPVVPGEAFVEKLIPIQDKINRLELKKAQNLAKKTIPKDLVEKLKKLDPNIIIPKK